MKKYSHKEISDSVEIGILASTLLDEIKYIYQPLFKYISEQNYLETPDNFNAIRTIMPLIELSSKIEFNGDGRFLLQKLNVPKPDLIWPMFRHGLSHHIRPFYAVVNNERINWAVPQYPCEHYNFGGAIGIYAPKLLDDLANYLKNFLGNSKSIRIQTGLEFTEV